MNADPVNAPATPLPARDRLVRSSAAVATGTLLSRVTGLLRVAVLAYALGRASLADTYNLANSTPNIVYELLLGGVRDPQFGPLVVVGLGGIYVEVFADTAARLAPISEAEALTMLGELKTASLLRGARGEAPADLTTLAGIISRFAQLLVDLVLLEIAGAVVAHQPDAGPLLEVVGDDLADDTVGEGVVVRLDAQVVEKAGGPESSEVVADRLALAGAFIETARRAGSARRQRRCLHRCGRL